MKTKKLFSALIGASVMLSGLSGMDDMDNIVVQDCPGYNSWSFVQTLGSRLVCVYSRGSAHTIDEPARGVYVRTSDDGGKTWSEENVVCNLPDCGGVPSGKGFDQNGNMLLWIRHAGGNYPVRLRHELYESADGIRFSRIAQPVLDPMPMQISDIIHVPGVGLLSLWFAGRYRRSSPVWDTATGPRNRPRSGSETEKFWPSGDARPHPKAPSALNSRWNPQIPEKPGNGPGPTSPMSRHPLLR